MSRPSASRSRPSTGARPSGGRPSTGARPSSGARPGAADRVENRGDRGAGTPRDRVENRADRTANRLDRRGDFASSRPDRIENRQEWRGNRTERRDQIRDQVRENHPRLDFWSDHPAWARWRVNRPYRWATWAALGSWFPYGWSDPTYYYYGENVYYDDGDVYYGDEVYCSADEYAQQAEAIATNAPDVNQAEVEWMPLGVFALTQDGQSSGADPSMFMQLVVSKEGVVSGTFQNTGTNTTGELEGMVDKKSQ